MSEYTYKITIADADAGSEPMTAESVLDYIILRLQSQSVISVVKAERVDV